MPASAGNFGPGVSTPTRFSGSAPESETQSSDSVLAPRLAQQTDRLGQSELLAGESGDEAAAADFASRLHRR